MIPDRSKPFIYFRVDRRMVKIFHDDILYVESLKDYINLYTATNSIVTNQSIASVQELLPVEEFIRIHSLYLVAKNKIETFNSESVEVGGKQLPIGRMYKNNVAALANTAVPPGYQNSNGSEKKKDIRG